jgi:hypothetical protein
MGTVTVYSQDPTGPVVASASAARSEEAAEEPKTTKAVIASA